MLSYRPHVHEDTNAEPTGLIEIVDPQLSHRTDWTDPFAENSSIAHCNVDAIFARSSFENKVNLFILASTLRGSKCR